MTGLAVACMFRDSLLYMREWIEYHRMLGVEKFYLCDHRSIDRDQVSSILKPLIASGVAELEYEERELLGYAFEETIHNPFYRRILEKTRNTTKWLACIDVDEFVFPKTGSSIPELLKGYEKHPAISVNWHNYGTSNVERLGDHQLLIESMVMRAPNDNHWNSFQKCIVQPSMTSDIFDVHSFKYIEGEVAIANADFVIQHYALGDERYFNNVKIPFYRRCNCEYYLHERHPQFNTIYDLKMERFIAPLRARMQKGTL
jgi:hypothetical protein